MSLSEAHEIIKSADMTQNEVAWLEYEIRNEAERQVKAGNHGRAATLFDRARHLFTWGIEARAATPDDEARLKRDYKAFVHGLPRVYAKVARMRRAG